MLEKKDIEQAKNLFKEWDLDKVWHSPTLEFIEHSRRNLKKLLRAECQRR